MSEKVIIADSSGHYRDVYVRVVGVINPNTEIEIVGTKTALVDRVLEDGGNAVVISNGDNYGLDALQEIRADGNTVPYIVCGHFAGNENMIPKFHQAGANIVLSKDGSSVIFERSLETALRNYLNNSS